ncbi:MAG: HPr kinase/phosphorylase [Paracoccaceae bacterium]|jgi:HPr kinase/phosphorylase
MQPPPNPTDPHEVLFHATTVAVGAHALMITGASGSGKSALALQLIALGACLVADDATLVRCDKNEAFLRTRCVPSIRGQIEARGIGILTLPHRQDVPLFAVIDLDRHTASRLPERQKISILDHDCPLLNKEVGPHFASTLILCLTYGVLP